MSHPIGHPSAISTGTASTAFPIALTVDVHEEDRPADVSRAACWLHQRGIPATVFVPSALFEHVSFRPHIARLPSLGFEVGSHGHNHDYVEIRALMHGAGADLNFLRRSHARYRETFGSAPISFRSPAWCPLGPGAIAALIDIGYRVDSSATPQRLPILSSTPYANTWIGARRGIHELAPGLLEVPTSCLLLPAASPAFLTLRRRVALAFVRLLLWEARRWTDRVPCVQLHVSDFVPDAAPPAPEERLGVDSFLPKPDGGLRFKVFLRERDPGRVYAITQEIIEALQGQHGARFVRMQDLAAG
jgi:peptidoglycan/xylan/chitin deacetylase (PgdA/CDA1 family)